MRYATNVSCRFSAVEEAGEFIDRQTFARRVRSCTAIKDLFQGKQLHQQILSSVHREDRYLRNLLIEMYGKCGAVEDARLIFISIRDPNLFSWNIMLAALTHNGNLDNARELFARMPEKDVVSWNSMVAAYTQAGRLEEARSLFEEMENRDSVGWNSMLYGYARLGRLTDARDFFQIMPERDVVTWNILLAAYTQNGQLEDAQSVFETMPQRNLVSWNTLVSGYAQRKEEVVKARMLFERMPEKDVVSWNAILSAYALNGFIAEAEVSFRLMPIRNAAAWNIMLTGYAQAGRMEDVRRIFRDMPVKDVVAWNAVVTAYCQNGEIDEARCLFEKMASKNSVSWNVMITSYAQANRFDEAQELFDRMPCNDCVSWTALITALSDNGQSRKAMRLFKLMDQEGIYADKTSFVGYFNACAGMNSIEEAKLVWEDLLSRGFETDPIVAAAMVTLHAKCGKLEESKRLFAEAGDKNVISWSGMIAAYAQNGEPEKAVELFGSMVQEGVDPDDVTMISVLSSCAHAGLVEKGLEVFAWMGSDYGICCRLEHYNCVIDLLGRGGWLSLAQELLETMPLISTAYSWNVFLAACGVHGDSVRGLKAAERVLALESDSSSSGGVSSPYVLLSNAFSAAGRQYTHPTSRDELNRICEYSHKN